MKARAASLPALPMACGTLIAVLAFYGRSWFEYALLALAFTAGVLTAYYGVRRSLYYFLFGLLGGILSCYVSRIPDIPANLYGKENTTYSFELLSVGEGPRGMHCLGKATPPFNTFRAYINLTDKSVALRPGDIIKLDTRADDIFHTSDLPFMESAKLAARCDGVSARILASPDDIRIIGHADSFRYRMLDFRDRLAIYAYNSDLPPDVSSLIASVCLGTADTPVSVKERFRAGGIAHLLCVSGFHVGIVAWLSILILWPLRLWSHGGRIRYLLIVLIVWLYVGLIGFTPSAIRAAIMLSVYYTGRILQRGSSSFNSLILAFAILLLVQPRWLYSIGMQLSICAVLGILVFAARLNPTTPRYRTLYRLCEIFTVPTAAVLGTAPILLFRFHTIPLLTVITNAFTTVLFAPFLLIGVISTILNNLGLPVDAPATLLTFIYNMIVRLCEYSSPDNTLSGIYLTDFRLILLITGIILLAVLVHATSRKVRLASGAAIFAIAGLSACDNKPEHGNEIIVAGNNASSEIIMRHGGKGYTIAISNNLGNFPYISDYFGGYGIPADSIVRNPNVMDIDVPGLAIATKHRKYRLIQSADYLIVDGSCEENPDEYIEIVNPQFAILCANMPDNRRNEWENICNRKGVTIMRLGSKAIRIKL